MTLKKLFLLFPLLTSLGISAQDVDCNLTVNPTSVTCFGSTDGKAEIWKDGKLIVLSKDGTPGDPPTCVTPETSPYSCGSVAQGDLVSYAVSDVVEIPDGKTLYLKSSFNGAIRFLGASTLVICGSATITNFQMNNGSKPVTVIINGQATLSSSALNLDKYSTVKNYGTLTLSHWHGFLGKLFNHNRFIAMEGLSITSDGQMYNSGEFQVNGSYNNFNSATNAGHMTVTGDFKNNGGSYFKNLCSIKVGAEFYNATTIENYGIITGVTSTIANTNLSSSNNLYKGYAGSLLNTKNITVEGIIDGVGTACASIKVAATTTINGGGVIRNLIDFCDANGIETNGGTIASSVTTNCSCPTSVGTGTKGTVTWGTGTSTLNGSTVINMKGGSSKVTVKLDGCLQKALDVNIPEPTQITSTLSVSGTTVTVSGVGGGNTATGNKFYDWKKLPNGPITTTTNVATRTFSATTEAGDYTVTVRDSKGCLGSPLSFTIQGQGTTCNFTVVTTPVTCYGGSDGKVIIYKDGQPWNVPASTDPGTGNGSNSGIPTGNPGTCMTPETSPYNCSSIPSGTTVYSQSSGTVSVATGQTIYITSAFNGDLSIGGGVVVICGNATINNFNFSQNSGPFTLAIAGTATLTSPNLNLKNNCTVKNYGTLATKSIGFNASMENHGAFTVDGSLNSNTGTNTFLNTGTVTINNNFDNVFTTINGGTFWVKGVFNNNQPTSSFVNYCTLKVDGALNNNKAFENRGYILVPNDLSTFNSSSYYKGYSGSVLYTKNFMNNGTVEGINSCASLRVLLTTTLNSNSVLKGFTYLCDANGVETSSGSIQGNAALNCSCGGNSTVTSSGNPVVWTGYPNVKGNTNDNLGKVTNQTVVISVPGCTNTTLTYSIGGPANPISATVTTSGCTGTVSVPTGGNGATASDYKYLWSPDNFESTVRSRTYDFSGSFTVKVKDNKGCEGPVIPFDINCAITECVVKVDYSTANKVLVQIQCPDTCKYRIKTAGGALLTYGSLIKRPCQDSLVTSVNCQGKIIQTLVSGSGLCVPSCNPTTDPNCPCNLATDPTCPTGCNPLLDPTCACQSDNDPNCTRNCTSGSKDCPCDPHSPSCIPCTVGVDGCPPFTVDYTATPPKCGAKGTVTLLITGGSGSFSITNDVNPGGQGMTMYELPEGPVLVTVIDNATKAQKQITAIVPTVPLSEVKIQPVVTGGACDNQFTITVTNAVAGPYILQTNGAAPPYYQDNLQASNGTLQLGPYTIPDYSGDGPFRITLIDNYCTNYDQMVTKCNKVCTTPASTSFVPTFDTPQLPSSKGAKDGKLALTNLPAGVSAYWTGTNLNTLVSGATLSGIGAGKYYLLLIDNTTKCRFYYDVNGKTLGDGPVYKTRFALVGDCNYEANVVRYNANGTLNTTPLPSPLTYSWINPATGAQVASGKQFNVGSLASSLSLNYVILQVKNGDNLIARGTFRIPKNCLPVTLCPSTITYRFSPPTCFAGANGSIRILSLSANNTISWTTPALQNPGPNDWYKPGLAKGTYNLNMISSIAGCAPKALGILLPEPDQIAVSYAEISTGGVKVTATKGVAPYSFKWTDKDPAQTAAQEITRTDMTPGTTYTVTVTDAANCSNTLTFLYDPCAFEPLEAKVLLDGTTATAIASPATREYTYLWTPITNPTTFIFDNEAKIQDNLSGWQGTFSLEVTEKIRGCKSVVTFDINNCGLTATVTPTSASKRTLCDGKALLEVKKGGTLVADINKYAILWDEQDIKKLLAENQVQALVTKGSIGISNVCGGAHEVTVVGPEGCAVKVPFNVEFGGEPTDPCDASLKPNYKITGLDNSPSFNRVCAEDELNVPFGVKGGRKEYTYFWTRTYTENGVTKTATFTADKAGLSNPPAGNYALRVVDADGCERTANLTIGGATDVFVVKTTPTHPVCTGGQGKAKAFIEPALSGVTYSWSHAGGTLAEIPIPAGTLYTVTATVGTCKKTADVEVKKVLFNGEIYFNRDKICPGTVALLSAKSQAGYTFQWSGPDVTDKNKLLADIEAGTVGTYTLTYSSVDPSCAQQSKQRAIGALSNCSENPIECKTYEFDFPALDTLTTNVCLEQQLTTLEGNARNAYHIYVEERKKQIKTAYRAKLMSTLVESLTMSYTDNEQQYTLYYYDQAGNLVRTVPPAGVAPLSQEATAIAATNMQQGSTDGVYPEHTMATTYRYNSLNQLVSQDMPDHNQQDLWEVQPALTLGNGEQVGAVGYVNSTRGLLFANNGTETKLYTTNDAGTSWNSSFGVQVGDILDVFGYTNTTTPAYYAVGTQGLFAKSSNGTDWLLAGAPTTGNLVDVYFTSPLAGRVMEENGTIWSTQDGGQIWTLFSNSLVSQNVKVTDTWNEGTSIWIVAKDASNNQVVYANTSGGGDFSQQQFIASGFTTLAMAPSGGNTVPLLAGMEGTLFSVESGKLKIFAHTDLNRKIQQLIYKNSTYTALTYTAATFGEGSIYTSTDAIHWTQAGTATNVKTLFDHVGATTVGAITSDNKYGNSSNWNNFALITATPATGSTPLTFYYLISAGYAPNAFLTGVSNVEVVTGGNGIAYRTATGWQQVQITNFSQNLRKIYNVAANDLLVLTDGNSLFRTQAGSGTNVLTLRNNGQALYTDVLMLYPVGSTLYAYRQSIGFVKLVANADGTVTSTTLYDFPNYKGYYDISDLSLTANGQSLDIRVVFKDNTLWTRKVGETVWTQQSNVLSPAIATVTGTGTGTSTTAYAAGGSEIYKYDPTAYVTPQTYSTTWRYQPLLATNLPSTPISDNFLDGTVHRLALGSTMYRHDPATFQLVIENATPFTGPVNEAKGNTVVTTDAKIYERNAGLWDKVYPGNPNQALTDVNPPLAASTKTLYFRKLDLFGNASWVTANPFKVQPINAVANAAEGAGTRSVAVGNQGTVLVSTDKGDTWQVKPLGNAQNLSTVATFGGKVLAGSQPGPGYTKGSLFYSANGGSNWNLVTISPALADGEGINAIAFTNAGAAWAVSGKKLLYCGDIAGTGTSKTFTVVFTSATQNLNGLSVDTDGYGYVVGNTGTAYRIQPTTSFTDAQKLQASCTTTPAALTPLTNLSTYSLLKICPDANVADDKGSGLPDTRSYKAVSFTDRLTGYLTGPGALLLKTVDGGYHWKPEDGGTGTGSPQIALANGEKGTLVQADGNVKGLRDRAQQIGSRFWYDQLGRLVLSQNAKQYKIKNYLGEDQYSGLVIPTVADELKEKEARAYSYTLYDEIGRIREVGELITNRKLDTWKHETQVLYSFVEGTFTLPTNGVKHQVTNTYYDEAVYTGLLEKFEQENLRPRVASVTYSERPTFNSSLSTVNYDRATHYSYDVHGNVKTLVQQIDQRGGGLLTKRIDYDYDLVSGKVNKVYYQKDAPDQFIHKYKYDGDNRLTCVQTSRNGADWETDAKYQYYAHGPLGRVKIGDTEVETQDLAYTLQGWMKNLKGQQFSYALGYYEGDYTGITGATASLATPIGQRTVGGTTTKLNLYNGNIAAMATEFGAEATARTQDYKTLTQQFEYDQLNRIKASTRVAEGGKAASSYATGYTYDYNGNLKTLTRNDMAGQPIDNLSYNYELKSKGYQATTNKLRWVDDSPDPQYLTGARDQEVDNFGYDDIGNLRSDVREGIGRIEWTTYGKVSSVTRAATGDNANNSRPNLVFAYDASGNRVSKTVTQPAGSSVTTYYLRDASGNVMGTYDQQNTNLPTLSELDIYGSSRLGLLKPGTDLTTSEIKGLKSYEVTDHLGNVSVVLSDIKSTIIGVTGYYPFGMAMGGRTGSTDFRYGFNGKEKDEENGWEDYGMRMYNPQIAKFLSVDKEIDKFPFYSPYHFAGNNPILAIDLDGLEPYVPVAGTEYLLIVIQGYGSDPKKGATQAVNAVKDNPGLGVDYAGIGLLESFQSVPQFDVAIFASSKSDVTKEDVKTTIENYRKSNPHGKVIIVGHSAGGDNAIELVKENPELKVELLITLDTQDPKVLGRDDDNIPENVDNAINYYQNTEFIGGEQIEIKSTKSKGANILSPGSNHRSIDSDQNFNITMNIHDFVKDPVTVIEKAKQRTQSVNVPDQKTSPNINLPLKLNESKTKLNKSL